MRTKNRPKPLSQRDILPDKPSELILVALADLEKIEADPRYKVNMYTWHEPTEKVGLGNPLGVKGEPVCEVCMAGSVMAKTLKLSPKTFASPGDGHRDPRTRNKLEALNAFRVGQIRTGLALLGLHGRRHLFPDMLEPNSIRTRNNPQGELDSDELSDVGREEWMAHMLDLAGIFAAEGL